MTSERLGLPVAFRAAKFVQASFAASPATNVVGLDPLVVVVARAWAVVLGLVCPDELQAGAQDRQREDTPDP